MEAMTGPAAAGPLSSMRLSIDEESQIGAARRAAVSLGHAKSFTPDAIGRLAIVVTEAATNILRHAGHGVIVLRALVVGKIVAIEVLALDKGPGIPDIARAMHDGFSTSGTGGHGLGGIQRLADLFEIYSHRGKGTGTALVARISNGARRSGAGSRTPAADDQFGVVCVPMRGETECGDAWQLIVSRQRISILLVDGLGHGPQAAAVAATATTAFSRLASGTPEAALVALDTALRGGRGAALSVTMIDEFGRATSFSGVGNVDGRVLDTNTTTHLVPQNGIVGHTMPTVRSTTTPWRSRARLIMHSDGISARWRMDAYPGLMSAHPALIAGVIYRDFARDRDDATVLVLGDRVSKEQQ